MGGQPSLNHEDFNNSESCNKPRNLAGSFMNVQEGHAPFNDMTNVDRSQLEAYERWRGANLNRSEFVDYSRPPEPEQQAKDFFYKSTACGKQSFSLP